MTVSTCPFCTLPIARIEAENNYAVLILDAFPVSPGHSLVIPKRHVGSYFETTDVERLDMHALLVKAKLGVEAKLGPQGYNIGVNDGAAAGQTVTHLHMHLIPRYVGDVTDPRGGVRWVIADKADYWTTRPK